MKLILLSACCLLGSSPVYSAEGLLECEPGIILSKNDKTYHPAIPAKQFVIEVGDDTNDFSVEKVFSSEDFSDQPVFGGFIAIRLYGDRLDGRSEIMRMSATVEHLSRPDPRSARVYAEAVQVSEFGSSPTLFVRSQRRGLYQAGIHCNFSPAEK